MKRIIAIFLLLQIASNNAFAEELVKMPKLFTHFYHHTYEHKDTRNFLDFLHKHYSGQHAKDSHQSNEDEEDCKLPFKHCNGCCVGVHAPALGFVPASLNTDFVSFLLPASDFIREDDRIESQHLCSIWQPPKLA